MNDCKSWLEGTNQDRAVLITVKKKKLAPILRSLESSGAFWGKIKY